MLKFVITTLFLYFLHLPILFSGSFVVLRFGNSSALLMQKTESVSEESKENHENNRLCQTSRISLSINVAMVYVNLGLQYLLCLLKQR